MLELRNVTKTFNLTGNKEDLRTALDHINLQIESGEFVTIIGSNGSGKSTTVNVITGSVKPDSGQVLLNNVDITKLDEHQRASYFGHVFQDPMLGTSGDMSVLENLEIAYRRGRKHSPFLWGFRKSHKQIFINELKRFDLGLEDHEIPEFLERIEKLKDVYLDKEAIINFLHNGYTTNVFDLRDFSSKHFSTTRPM